jgi:hypothetical protein
VVVVSHYYHLEKPEYILLSTQIRALEKRFKNLI